MQVLFSKMFLKFELNHFFFKKIYYYYLFHRLTVNTDAWMFKHHFAAVAEMDYI